MNKSETIKELATALNKAQADMPAAELNATNTFLKNKYADLGSVIKASKPVLAKHGLSVSQLPTSNGEKIGVTTVLMHASGEWLESTMMLPVGEAKGLSSAQVAGSIISYLRRYSLASVLGIYADEDTDGNTPKSTRKTRAKPGPKSKTKSNSKMSLESASEVTNREGTKYIDIDSETLSHMSAALAKSLKEELDDKDREEREYKLDAIKEILAFRNE